MDVKAAVKKSIEYVADLFMSEDIVNIGLEEVILNEDENVWEVTIGFSRPWDFPQPSLVLEPQQNPKRQYKIVRIDNVSERVQSILIRKI